MSSMMNDEAAVGAAPPTGPRGLNVMTSGNMLAFRLSRSTEYQGGVLKSGTTLP